MRQAAQGRIIPAYAGSTKGQQNQRSLCRDHPRVCGEHSLISTSKREGEGSSPRMRGALVTASQNTFNFGIIPAYAGSTYHFPLCDGALWDHPRVCGEHAGYGF